MFLIALAFGVDIDKDVVRRVLMVHYRPESDSGGTTAARTQLSFRWPLYPDRTVYYRVIR
jgi:hypothetical protein